MYTISRLAGLFDLSRSTLLYYDRIGILTPGGRTESNYRVYSDADRKRLEQICMYRKCGLSLEDIRKVMDGGGTASAAILEEHLDLLNRRISELRNQQHVILSLLKNDLLRECTGVMDITAWSALLRAAGMDDEGMHKWHIEFEKMSPKGHHAFLESLGLPETEIERIRQWSGKK